MHAIAAILFGLFLIGCGIAHFSAPAYFADLVPAWLPWPRQLVAVSGIVEVTLGTMIIVPATRTHGSWLAAAMLAAYLLLWLDRLRSGTGGRAAAAAGVAVNAAYLAWGGYVAMAGG
ncbi:hypothetical protein IU421_11980 [Nocardia cyriacigeorgica]|uniref:hypothetical protein n=1 Tax=Nocardia cyriacigeorgica TaxID=135487 RepID=UPI001893B269|nr:hypothetical protein [Nocardia cyriacigeorgica]MBF6342642.1 hypothetical protein [Nocardia cyriacigeorgica]MBF6515000.1 hypothetical protein [Nocardia cyriacigeorgica]